METIIGTKKYRAFKFHTGVQWMRKLGIRGVVIGRHICFADDPENLVEWVFRHELEHAYQQMRDGRIRFYLRYFWFQIRYGYLHNPYEVTARAVQGKPLTTSEEITLWRLKNDCKPSPSVLVTK